MKITQILFVLIILCSSMPLTAVSDVHEERLTIVSGNNQTSAVGSELVNPFVVRFEA